MYLTHKFLGCSPVIAHLDLMCLEGSSQVMNQLQCFAAMQW